MPSFSVDLSEGVERRLLPGNEWYAVEIANVEVKTSSTGTPMLSIMFAVIEGQYEGQNLFTNWMLAGKGAGITKGAFRVLFGDEFVDSGEDLELDTDDLVGEQLEARVTQRVWAEADGGDGEMQNRITKYRPIGAGADLDVSVFDE